MAKLRDGLEIVAENLELRRQLAEKNALLEQAEADRDELAIVLCRTAEFDEWLLDQDVSSAHMRKPGPTRKAAEIEGASDLDLALQYARRAG